MLRPLDPAQFESAFRGWVGGIVGAVEGLVAIDGKTVRGSADGVRAGIHLVSAYATAHGLSLDQVKVAEKSNEIVCHECNRRRFGGLGVLLEMTVGPSKSAYRSRFQTATSCGGKEPSW